MWLSWGFDNTTPCLGCDSIEINLFFVYIEGRGRHYSTVIITVTVNKKIAHAS